MFYRWLFNFEWFYWLFSKINPGFRNDYLKWREAIFSISPSTVGVVADDSDLIYGVIMDVGLSDSFVITTPVWINGESSLKTTIGGGVIGLSYDEFMKNQAKEIVAMAQSLVAKTELVTIHDLPKSNMIRFYFLTTSGIRCSEVAIEEVGSETHPLNDMFLRFGMFKIASDKIMDGWHPQA